MPNWTTNYTTFIGSKNTIDTIYSYFDVDEDIFDFDKVVPMPEALRATASPVKIIDDAEFKEEHGVLPHTKEEVDDFFAQHKREAEKSDRPHFGVQDITQTMSTILKHNYGADNWYDWCNIQWGVKWPGSSVSIEYKSDNILLVFYDTPWDTPEGIFDLPEGQFDDLTLLNMAHFEGVDEAITATWGDEQVNKVYWSIKEDTELDIYDTVTEDNIEFISPWFSTVCNPNMHNVETMDKHGFFIDNWSEAQFFPGFKPEKKESDAD